MEMPSGELRCWYCGTKLLPRTEWDGNSHPKNLHVRDHQIPKSWKWPESSRSSNLVDACWSCNSSKRDLDVGGYRRAIWLKTPAGQAQELLSKSYQIHFMDTEFGDFFRAILQKNLELHPLPSFYGEEVHQ